MASTPTWAPPPDFRDQLEEHYGLTCPPWYGLPRRFDRPTLGPRLSTVMGGLGTPPMPWQRYVNDVALEIDPETGYFAYPRVGLSVMRQQGKTAIVFGVVCHRCLAWDDQRVYYTAQTGQAAAVRWREELLPAIRRSEFAGAALKERGTKGAESLPWENGSLLALISGSESAGHGPPLDLGVIDEAFAQKDHRAEQAMSPAMLTRPMSQLWWASAGGTDLSVYLNDKRKQGRAAIQRFWETGEWPEIAYFEWFAPPEMPRDDPRTWAAVMPALCPAPPCRCDPEGVWHHTVTDRRIRSELAGMSTDLAKFDRAYLNRTDMKEGPPEDPKVPTKEWRVSVDARSRRGPTLAFGIDATPLRDHAAIAVYSPRPDGRIHVELVDLRPGTEWVVAAALRLRELWDPVAFGIDSKGPAGGLIRPLTKAGIGEPKDHDDPKRGELWVPNVAELVIACGDIAEEVRRGKIAHIDQVEANTAIEGTQSRSLGDGFAWARRTSSANISPWCGMTVAGGAYRARSDKVAKPYNPLDNIW